MDVEEYKNLIRENTPTPIEEKKRWALSGKLCCVYLEFRPLEDFIPHNLNNIANVYGNMSDVGLCVVFNSQNKDIITEATNGWSNVMYYELQKNDMSVDDYSRLLTLPGFWEKFSDFEFAMINQWDSYLFKPFESMFFNFDYVGSPCAHFYILDNNGVSKNVCSFTCTCDRCKNDPSHMLKDINFVDYDKKFMMLNGGLSLRRVSKCIELCKTKNYDGEPEDVYFALSNLTRPMRIDCMYFAVQDPQFACADPAGCHQIWIRNSPDYVRELFTRKR